VIEHRDKFRFDPNGRMVAAVGILIADVQVGGETFPVAGVGNVIVTRSQRGKGLLRPLLEAALEHAAGPDRALLWCTPKNVPIYARLGVHTLDVPVFVEQPAGELRMPVPTMWKPLREGVTWPAGEVRVPGLPF
jgi:hypothetical protein